MTIAARRVVAVVAMQTVAVRLGAGEVAATKQGGAKAPPPDCRKDADCVLVPDDCCPCSAGGKQRAIPLAKRDAYEKERRERCAETMCTSMMSTDPSCSATKAICKAA